MTDGDTIAETHDGSPTHPDSILTPYRGQPVTAAGIAIPNAAGGLQAALAVDPVELEIGSIVHVVLQCEVRPPQYDPIDKDNNRGPLRLVNRLHALEGTFVDAAIVKAHLDEQRERIQRADALAEQRDREQAGEIPLFDPDSDEPNGKTMPVGEVLDRALDLAQDAEDGAEWRRARTAELDQFDKPGLLELAGDYEIRGRTGLTKSELVDAICDHEEEQGGAA